MTEKDKTQEQPKPQTVYQAIAAVTESLSKEGISKDKKNKDQGYTFRGIDDMYNALAPFLAANRLCVLPCVMNREVVERKSSKGTPLFYVTVQTRFDFVSADDGSKHEVVTYGEAMDSSDKATNKAMSAAYKYACMQAFCIPTEGDNDADASTHEVAAPAGVFASLDELNAFVTNCIEALGKAMTLDQVKDQRDLNAARVNAMKNSPVAEDREGYQKIITAQNALVKSLKDRPSTVEGAKQSAALPASVADDEIQF